MDFKKVLIVGGVAGGASAAARLRRLREHDDIIMFERGEHISFANCGLPYYIGGEINRKADLTLQTPESFQSRFNVDVRVMQEVTAINTQEKFVTVFNHKTGVDYTESYDKLILSPGAEPIIPNIDGISNSERIFTLRNIPDTFRIKQFINENNPCDAVVVGGGYIGLEMAENLKKLGINVTLVEMQEQIAAILDYDMACEVHRHIKHHGINLILSQSLTAVSKNANNLTICLKDTTIKADMLILAIGVRPETTLARDAGIELNSRGGIIVDKHMRTSNPDIFAVGDAIEVKNFVTNQKTMIPLAGPANKQGRIAADNISGIQSSYTGTQGSSILRIFDLTIATTGINEKTARQLDIKYGKIFTYSASHASYFPGAQNMSVKTIFDETTGKILGAQFVGMDGVDKRCDIMATAIRFGASAKDLTELELCYAPPYSSAKDPVNMIGFAIENILSKKVQQFHWHDIERLKKSNNVILLDTRTSPEFANGHIDGFLNIPLNSLRKRLDELDKNKPIYVTCQIGMRGYIACRILAQNGFECYNLSGGYRLYRTVVPCDNNLDDGNNDNHACTYPCTQPSV